MKKFIVTTWIMFIGVSLSLAQEIIPNQIIVRITEDAKIQDVVKSSVDLFGEDSEIRVLRELSERMHIWLIGHNNETSSQAIVDKLYLTSGVVDAQLNHKVQLRETVPNDTEYDTQWQHQNIQSELAWDITTGGMTGVGDEIVVCVIEGGNAEHVDLVDNCWRNEEEIPDNGIDDDLNGYVDDYDGWNVNSDSDNGVFQGGHGTNVMGMIGAKGDNDLGVAGANWDVKIMSVAGENVGNEASLVEAYDYPYNMRMLYEENGGTGGQGAFVVATNASWGIDGGNPEDSPVWCGIYQTLGEGGILSCGATANNNVDIDALGDLPTACSSDYMISVTATNTNDERTFSGYGATTIDLGAPGDNIYTTSGADAYTFTSGTSFASPITAGVIALLYSAPCSGLGVLAHEDPQGAADLVRQVLLDGVDPVESLEGECVTGGRLNAFNSLQLLLAICSEDACFAPFSTNLISEDNVSFEVEWASFSAENTYSFRHRMVGAAEWTEILDLEENSFDFGELEWCTEYEYEIKASCGDLEADWTPYPTFLTDGCCVAPDFGLITAEALEDDSSISLEWPSVLAAESFTINYNAVGEASQELTDITGNTYILEGLTACTNYEIQISTSCSDDSSESTESVEIRTTGCGHCTDSEFCDNTHETSETEYIDSFSIGDLTNNSGDNGGYMLFEDEDIVLNRGNTFSTQVVAGYANQTYSETFVIWLDSNQDGEFSEDEILTSEIGVTEMNSEITIPTDALLGNTRIRVSMVWENENNQGQVQEPCGEYDYGETEDYCVTVDEFDSVSEILKITSLFPNPSQNEITISLPVDLMSKSLVITDATGRTVKTLNTSSTQMNIDISELTSGTYFLEIRDNSRTISQTKFLKL